MKKIKKLLFYVVNIYSCIFSPNFFRRIQYIKARIYTVYLSKYIKSIGYGSCIYPPLNYNGLENITIGNKALIGKYSILNAITTYLGDKYTPRIEIGDATEIGEYAHISSINAIIIGNNVLTGRWLTIVDNSHGKMDYSELGVNPTRRKLFSKGPTTIEDYVWIGDKVSIMPGVTIGAHSIIGCNSVVTKNIPKYSLVAGCPARVIRNLEDGYICNNSKL